MVFSIRAGAVRLILFIALCTLCSCSGTSPDPMAALPTFDNGQSVTQPSPATTPAERVWETKPFGADQVTVLFTEPRCVGYKLGDAQPVSNCMGSGTVVAVQGTTTDSTGSQYTIVAGRTFSDTITVVAAELDNAENTPILVSDGGFTLILPGARRAIALVPIDQFGNLVGDRLILP